VDISFTVCNFCLFVRLRISSPRIKLAASHFAKRFVGVQGETHFGELCSQKPKIRRIDHARWPAGREGVASTLADSSSARAQLAGHALRDVNIAVVMRQRKRHARDLRFAEYRAACGRRIGNPIGMCG